MVTVGLIYHTDICVPRLGGPQCCHYGKEESVRTAFSNRPGELIRTGIIICAFVPGQQRSVWPLAGCGASETAPLGEAFRRQAPSSCLLPIPRLGYLVSPITLATLQ